MQFIEEAAVHIQEFRTSRYNLTSRGTEPQGITSHPAHLVISSHHSTPHLVISPYHSTPYLVTYTSPLHPARHHYTTRVCWTLASHPLTKCPQITKKKMDESYAFLIYTKTKYFRKIYLVSDSKCKTHSMYNTIKRLTVF